MELIKRFLLEFKGHYGRFILLVLALIMAALFEVTAPLLLGKIVDSIVNALEIHAAFSVVLEQTNILVLILVVLYLLHALFTYCAEYVMANISQRIVFSLRSRLAAKLHVLPMTYFHKHQRGDVLSRITAEMDNVSETLQECVPGFISSVIGLTGAFIMMFYLSPILALSIVAIIVVGVGILYVIGQKARRIYGRNQVATSDFNSGVEEAITGKAIIQAFGLEPTVIKQMEIRNEELFHSVHQASFIGQMIYPFIGFLNQISYVVVAVEGCILVIRQAISLGDMQAFFLYLTQVADPISRISYILTKLQETLSSLSRVYEILDEEAIDNNGQRQFNEPVRGEIAFNHVKFGYDDKKPLMQDLNLHIPAGSRIAIVGMTGAGKTTLAHLLLRLYEVQAGEVTIDGINITELPREELHSHIAMVLQDAWIFDGTIAENIAYGKPNATLEEIKEVAKLAMADFFIRTLPKGYDTRICQGGEDLSQGQRQLLSIARAFLADLPILVLDEATANVDTRTEVYVQKAMERLLKGRTSIVIAHRLSTIRNADYILVMKHGNIVEQGSHNELIARDGYYNELYKSYVQGMRMD